MQRPWIVAHTEFCCMSQLVTLIDFHYDQEAGPCTTDHYTQSVATYVFLSAILIGM